MSERIEDFKLYNRAMREGAKAIIDKLEDIA